jgi:peptidoglycan/LPS O-acetylase OafA/YrhL
MAATDSPSPTRPEIQALRAVAVTLVLVYHLWPASVPGGFVGVDVFFVISGFLITSHLLREVMRTGTVSVTHFWARRIRRLLPAAYTVLLASLAATVWFVPRSAWEQAYQEISASAVYAVNWLLAINSVDYLAADSPPSIVQHYWSLAVEEQFYIVWPLLILLAIALARRYWLRGGGDEEVNRSKSLVAIAVALGLIALGSLAFSIVATAQSQPVAYFITPTRAWEFGAGGLLAFAPGRLPSWVPPRVAVMARSSASWIGLAAIGLAALTFSAATRFPGYIALIPVTGTVLVIWAGDVRQRWAPTAVAGFGPIQLVGDLSYSIYLWHWPLIVVYPYLLGHAPGLRGGLVICALSVGLAWLTKVLVEDPFRYRKFWTTSRRHTYGLMGVGMLATLTIVGSAALLLQEKQQADAPRLAAGVSGAVNCFGAAALAPGARCPRPFAVPSTLDTAFASNDRGLFRICHAGSDTAIMSCAVGDPAGTVGVAVIGNSHALAFANGLDRYARENAWRLEVYDGPGCLGVALEQVGAFPAEECVTWTRAVIDRIVQKPGIDIVVFQSYVDVVPPEYTPEQRIAFVALMQTTWTRLLDAGERVAVISDVPGTIPVRTPYCVSREIHQYDPCRRPRDTLVLSNLMFEAAKQTHGMTAVDITPYFCDSTFCHSVIGGVVVYFDAHHMTTTYAVTLARIVGPELAGLLTP